MCSGPTVSFKKVNATMLRPSWVDFEEYFGNASKDTAKACSFVCACRTL